MKGQEIIVDEDLPPFLEAVGLRQADEIVMEAQNCKFNYGVEIHDPRIVEKLDYTVMPTKQIAGTPWYQILSNPDYADAFYYIGAHVEGREKLIKDGDFEEGNDCE